MKDHDKRKGRQGSTRAGEPIDARAPTETVHPNADAEGDEPLPEGVEPPPPGTRAAAIVRWVLIAAVGLLALGSVVHFSGWLDRPAASSSGTNYYCPMHPGVRQDHPGECPICHMTLVPEPTGGAGAKPGGGAPAGGGARRVPGLVNVDIGPERVQLLGLKTAPVVRTRLAGELQTVGFVAAPEDDLARVQARFAGWIVDLPVAQTGERVRKGQVLATIYSPELLVAQEEYLNALRWERTAPPPSAGAHGGGTNLLQGLASDARVRLELLGIARADIAAIRRSGRPKRALPLRAPVSGYVTRKSAVQGLYVQPGTDLFEVADLSSVWVLADVYEYELARVRPGLAATLRVPAHPEPLRGEVSFVYPAVDPQTRTLRVRVTLKNPGLLLRPGMFGNVAIATPPTEGLVVPAEALVDTGDVQYVFIARSGGRFEPRRVKVGAREGERVQILEGVFEGETVVTTANFLIDSESRLRAALAGESAAAPAPAAPGAPTAPAGAPTAPAAPAAPGHVHPGAAPAPAPQPGEPGQ